MLRQAIRQAVLNNGDGTNVQQLIPGTDQLSKPEFGAGPQEMQDAARYRKALRKRKKAHSWKGDMYDETDEGFEKVHGGKPKKS